LIATLTDVVNSSRFNCLPGEECKKGAYIGANKTKN
jgi:hypothetical protein